MTHTPQDARAIAIIQARMASTRFPGKVLQPIESRPMLAWVVEGVQRAEYVQDVVVATTTQPEDDVIVHWCRRHHISCYRGHPYDVLDRYYHAARYFDAQIVLRITADCPLLDPTLIDHMLLLFHHQSLDFLANRLPPPWGRSFPIGLDVEVFTQAALIRAWQHARAPHQREHVTPFFYDDAPPEALHFRPTGPRLRRVRTPRGFHIGLLHASTPLGMYRWTVDTPEDLHVVRLIVHYLGEASRHWSQVVAFLQSHPEIRRLNAHVAHKDHTTIDDRFAP